MDLIKHVLVLLCVTTVSAKGFGNWESKAPEVSVDAIDSDSSSEDSDDYEDFMRTLNPDPETDFSDSQNPKFFLPDFGSEDRKPASPTPPKGFHWAFVEGPKWTHNIDDWTDEAGRKEPEEIILPPDTKENIEWTRSQAAKRMWQHVKTNFLKIAHTNERHVQTTENYSEQETEWYKTPYFYLPAVGIAVFIFIISVATVIYLATRNRQVVDIETDRLVAEVKDCDEKPKSVYIVSGTTPHYVYSKTTEDS